MYWALEDIKNNSPEECLVLTQAKTRKNYSDQQWVLAKRAQSLYHNLGAPTIKNYKLLIQSNMIKDCPVTVKDVDIAEEIFGPDIAYSKENQHVQSLIKWLRISSKSQLNY